MFKKGLEKAAKVILVACLGALVYSCTPEDGKDGTNGVDGPAGANGTNGTNGTNGSNGVGFEEMLKYGTITVTTSGMTPSKKAFEQTNVFKFANVNASGSRVIKSENYLRFDLSRSLDVETDRGGASGFGLRLNIENLGTAQESKDFYTEFTGLQIKTANSTFFGFYGNFDNKPLPGDTNSNYSNKIVGLKIDGYDYDGKTGKLKFSFSYTVAADKNSTGNILTVKGQVDVIVLEETDIVQ
jgi:hypothetical protein